MFPSNMKIVIVLCACGFVAARSVVDLNNNEHRCGVEASTNPIHHNPWLVYLEFYRRGQLFERRCGATLITSRHLITAAHCVKKGLTKNLKIIARLGEYDLSSEVDCEAGTCADLPLKIDAAAVTLHPGSDGKEHDIAIITLAYEAPYTDTIRPICLPSGRLPEDAVFNAAGWGVDAINNEYSHLKKNLYLPHWSLDKCHAAYANVPLPKHIICAGGKRGVDTCSGDSGGPLTWGREIVQLWGVTSTGNTVCGTRGYPGIYVSVIEHLNWINTVISS